MDMKEQKLTVIGAVDPVEVVSKLRKEWQTVGPAKEPEKKKDDKKKVPNDQFADLLKLYRAYNPHMTNHDHLHSAEENPNACVLDEPSWKWMDV